MQLNSTINDKWKLCIIGSIFCCLILLFFLKQNEKFVSFSTASKTMSNFANLPDSEPPMSSIMKEPTMLLFTVGPPPPMPSIISDPSVLFTVSPPPLATTKEDFPQHPNLTSDLEQNKTILPYVENIAKKSFGIPKLAKKPTMKNNSNVVKKCDIFDGRWVYNARYKPSYDSVKCPFIEQKMSCRKNGRPDFDYEKWRWEANDCDIPLFNAKDMLERLRNKRVIIVGDSLNRNMWTSLACLLYSSLKPSRAQVYSKIRDYKYLKAKDYNAIIEFHWSPFLVDLDESNKDEKKILKLDKMSSNSKLWRGADIMVFNSGHWWVHRGKFKRWDLFQYKGKLIEEMSRLLAYDIGMKTWTKWVQKNVDPKKTRVFFRSISSTHNHRKQWCYNSTQPITDNSYEDPFPRSMINIVENVIQGMSKVHVQYLNITKLSKYRKDAHPSLYRTSKWSMFTSKYKRLIPSYADCNHWFLPGVPDTWNSLLYTSMFF